MDKTITELNSASALSGTEEIPSNQSGSTVKLLLSAIKTYILNGFSGSTSIITVGTVTTGTWFSSIRKRVNGLTSAANITPNIDLYDMVTFNALAANLNVLNPSGTPQAGQELILRIKDNGTPRLLSFDTDYRFSLSLAAPTTTTISKTMYLKFIYHLTDAKWDCIQYLDNF